MFTRSRLFFTRALPLRVSAVRKLFIYIIFSVYVLTYLTLHLIYCFQNVFNVEYQNNARFLYSITATRSRSTTPLNTVVMFVPQQEVRFIAQKCNGGFSFNY